MPFRYLLKSIGIKRWSAQLGTTSIQIAVKSSMGYICSVKYWLLILTIAFGACKARRVTDQYLQTHILGTWTEANDSNRGALRFVRADTFTKLSKGYTFRNDSTVTMYVPWGCQTPPYYKEIPAKWEVNKKGQIVINVVFYENLLYWDIINLTAKELRYIPSKK